MGKGIWTSPFRWWAAREETMGLCLQAGRKYHGVGGVHLLHFVFFPMPTPGRVT